MMTQGFDNYSILRNNVTYLHLLTNSEVSVICSDDKYRCSVCCLFLKYMFQFWSLQLQLNYEGYGRLAQQLLISKVFQPMYFLGLG